jgi:glycosyltransferase involved in cell wall biosynthesis
MRVVRFLDKSDARDRAELGRLYRSADVFILPTRNDCFGVVLAEANAYGVPAIAARTGGVPTVIADGVNGRLLPPDATGADYAHVIREVVSDQAGLRELRRRSRAAYESRLSWPVWAAAITDIAASLAEGRGRAA